MVAGLHVPVIVGELVELPGNNPGVAPTQYGPKAENVGVTFGFTFTVTEALLGHPDAEAVNVYVVVEVGLAIGFNIFVALKPVEGAHEKDGVEF
jgi:hypothetical protein